MTIECFIAIFHMELNFHFLIDDLKDKNIKILIVFFMIFSIKYMYINY